MAGKRRYLTAAEGGCPTCHHEAHLGLYLDASSAASLPRSSRGEEAVTVVNLRGRLTWTKCAICENPATCFGRYENATEDAPACDTCCGHGCEDGYCVPIADVPLTTLRAFSTVTP